jgi:hypothetical protein
VISNAPTQRDAPCAPSLKTNLAQQRFAQFEHQQTRFVIPAQAVAESFFHPLFKRMAWRNAEMPPRGYG